MSPLWTSTSKSDFINKMKPLYLNESIWRSIGTLSVCAEGIAKFAGPIAYQYYLDTMIFDEDASLQEEPSPETIRDANRLMNKMSQPVYTGWQFTSIEDRIEVLKKYGRSLAPFIKDDSGHEKYHKIFCKFDKCFDEFKAKASLRDFQKRDIDDDSIFQENDDIDETTSVEEVLAEKYLTTENKSGSDDIVIIINVDIFMETNMWNLRPGNNFNSILLKNVIAHELQHVVEQYIFRSHNALSSKPNQFFSDLSSSYILTKLNEKLQNRLFNIAYMISPEERRARLTQLDVFLESVCDKKPANIMKSILLNYKSENHAFKGKSSKENFMTALVRTETIIDITKMNTFTAVISRSTPDMLYLILGFFMEKHLIIKGSSMTESELILKLNNNYVLTNADRTFISKVRQKIEDIYETYAGDVNDTIYNYVERLMKLFGSKLFENATLTRDDIIERKQLYEDFCRYI